MGEPDFNGGKILSRYAFAISVKRKETENMTKAIEKLIDQFHKHFKNYDVEIFVQKWGKKMG